MKLRHLIAAAAVTLPLLAAARPAMPGVQTVYNPDGTSLQIIVHGDEFFSYTTDAEGSRVLSRDGQGFWRQLEIDGVKITPTASNIEMLRNRYGMVYNRPLARPASGQMRMADLDSEGRSTYPCEGEVHGLVMLVEFSDVPFRVPDIRNTIDRMVNEEGYNLYGSCGSARDYYVASSGGKFKPKFDVAPVVTLPYDLKHIVGLNEDGTVQDFDGAAHVGRFGEAIQYAVKYLDEQGWDFSKYDYDDNGVIDNIFFFYSGYGQADQPKNKVDDYGNYILDEDGKRIPETLTIWPHQYDYRAFLFNPAVDVKNLVVDGKTMATYACSNELIGSLPTGQMHPYLDGVGAFCHEFAHVLGLPDLYDTATKTTGVKTKTPGYFDIMCSGSYNLKSTCPPLFSSYEQWVVRWLEPTMAEDGTTYTLEPLTRKSEAVKIPVILRSGRNSPTEYYFMENRAKEGWDAGLPEDQFLIWHIRYSADAWTSNTVNIDGSPRIELMSSWQESTFGWPGANNITYTYPGASNALKPATTSLSPSFGVYLTGIDVDAETGVGTFGYNLIKSQPEDVTVLHDNPVRAETGRAFTLTWDPVEGATDYLLTVYRTDGNGNVYYVDSCNEKSVGNVTSRTIRNISSTAWGQEFTAYVRVVTLTPSSKTSNAINFVPSELSTGIDDVEMDDAQIYGGKGCIVAPEGAQAFDISGKAARLEGLTPGIYMVRHGGKTVKVLVK